MPTLDGGRIVVTLEGRDTNLGQLLSRIERQMQAGIVQARQYDTTIAQVTASQARQESATLAYAQSLARGAAASGDFAGAQRILATALQQVTPNTTAASNAINQLQRTINESAAAGQNQASIFTNMASQFNKLIGAYFAVSVAAKAFAEVIQTGNELEKQEALLRGLSGSTAAYEKNLAAAHAQQQRFGGSLADNIEAIANFANLSKRTGIEITRLTDLARGLAVIDPAQGFKGAGIALKEFFSGDITSLARRFEIPRDRLNAIKDIADQGQRLAALESVLREFGVTQELIASQANTTAVAYEKLGGAATDAVAAIGQALAQGLKPAAEAITGALVNVSNGINSLRTSGDVKLGIETTLITSAKSADQFNASIADVNKQMADGIATTQLGILAYTPLAPLLESIVTQGLRFQELTQVQLEFAQAALKSGQDLNTIRDAINALKPAFSDLENVFQNFPGNINATAQEFNAFEQAALRASAASKEGSTFAIALANAVRDGDISIQEATTKLLGYADGIALATQLQQAHAAATDGTTFAVQNLNTALQEDAVKAAEAAVNTATLKDLQAELASIAGAVASGHITAGNAAVEMAAKYNIAIDAAARLIALQLQLAGLGANGIPTSARRRGQEGGLLGGDSARPGKDNIDAAKANLKFLEDQKKLLEQNRQADIALARAHGNTAKAIDLMRQSQKGLNKDSAEFKKIEADIINLENSGRKAKGGGTKSPKLTENEKLHNQLAAQEDKFNAQMEDLERKHQENLLKIIQDFNKKQLETQQQNEILKRRSRFDFYTNLNKSTLNPIDRAAFAKAYEDAFAEAQKIAQSGRAKLAQEFLELRKRQIEELQQLAQEEQDIKGDKDLGKSEKEAKLRELEARRKLLLDAQEEERKQLLEGGDKNLNEFNDRIAEENKAYDDQATKIATAADRAADAKIAAAERAKKVVSDENKLYADQIALLDNITSKNGGRPVGVPPTAVNAPVPTTPAGLQPTPVDVTQPIPVTTDAPLPIQPPPFTTVKQLELFIVRDQGVIDALADQTVRLETKLESVNLSIANLGTQLGSKLDSVRNAIGQVKAARP